MARTLLAVAVTATLLAAGCASDQRGSDDRAAPAPVTAPGAPPGQVVEIVDTSGDPGGPTTHRVRYSSTGMDGGPIVVTGAVTVPSGEAPPGGFPVVGFGHGTTGLADQCAPSLGGQPAYYLDDLVASGYVVASSDYEGLGSPGLHPYLVGESEGRSILDIVRAAGELAPASGQVALFGHSQGGHAVLFAAELAPTYAPELEVVGVAPLAAPSDLDAGSEMTEITTLQVALSVVLIAAYAEAYGFDPADVLQPSVVDRLDVLEQGCVVAAVSAFSLPPDEVYLDPPGAAELVARYGARNNPGQAAPAAPVVLLHGEDDNLVPITMAERILDDYCALGVTVELAPYVGADHLSIVDAAQADLLGWIADRFSGRPAASSCPT